MQRRTFFKALFGGAGAAMLSHRADTQDRTILLQESRIAGFQYYRGDAIWPILGVGKRLSLVRESFNEHDREAVAVYFGNDKLGFVPQTENSSIAQMLDRGEHLEATISRVLNDTDPWERVRMSIFLV
jgi:hypothetical protein